MSAEPLHVEASTLKPEELAELTGHFLGWL